MFEDCMLHEYGILLEGLIMPLCLLHTHMTPSVYRAVCKGNNGVSCRYTA